MIIIYRDDSANSIFMQDNNGAQFLNSLQAVLDEDTLTLCSIIDLSRGIDLVTGVIHTDFVDINGNGYGSTPTEVCNNLNTIFVTSGTSTSNIPNITSSLEINSLVGDVINYELTADYGVGYEWGNLPSGLTTVNGNVRKLVGGSELTAGSYTPTMKAINYNGVDSETLTINVSSLPFSNSKSIKFVSNDYLSGSGSGLSSVLGRTGNGSGSGDAWTISLFFKIGTHIGGQKQTIFYFGDADHNNGGHIWVYYRGSQKSIYLEYGSKNNYIQLKSPNDSLVDSTWHHVMLTYDGGTTGSSSGDINDYYSRFNIYIDGVSVTTTDDHNNYGWSSGLDSDLIQVGKRSGGGDYMRNNCKVDELSLWGSDQSSNLTTIYNSGVPQDLSSLGTPPDAWWRLGDGDTYPTLTSAIGSPDLSMINMTSADIVNDVPL